MRSGLSIGETWATEARLLALAAERAGTPGEWTGGACPGGGAVAPDDLAGLVRRYGAYDIAMVSTDEEARQYDEAAPDERQRLRRRHQFAADATIASMERTGRVASGPDLGTAWVVARFFHQYDDQTRECRPHTHSVVVRATPAGMRPVAAGA